MNWKEDKLEAVVESLGRGRSPVYVESSPFRVLNQACIQDGHLNLELVKFTSKSHFDSLDATKKTRRDDIFVNSTGTGTIGRVGLWDNDVQMAFDSHVTLVRLKRALAARFFYYWLRLPQAESQIANCISGSTNQIELSRQQFRQLVVRYPACKLEQAAIGNVIEVADQVVHDTTSLIAKYQRIKKGLLHDLLTHGLDECGRLRRPQIEAPDLYQSSPLGSIPKDWEVGELGREIGPIISGWSPNCEPFPAAADEWAILKTTAIVWDGYRDTENKRLPDALNPVPSLEVRSDDILITRKGPVERVGVVVHVEQTRPHLMIPDTVFKVRLRPTSKVAPAFLPLALASPSVQTDWFGKKIGLADAQVDINHGIVRGTLFPLPPPSEQERIVLTLGRVRGVLLSLQRELEKYERIKDGLAQDLLTGLVSVETLVAQVGPGQ